MNPALKIGLIVVIVAAPAFARGPQEITIPGPQCARTFSFLLLGDENAGHRIHPVVRLDLLSILLGYPASCGAIRVSQDKRVWLIMHNGMRILYDDGQKKTFEEKLNDPDLKDMLSQVYEPGPIEKAVPADHDPGRFRVQPFFKAVYGNTKSRVRSNLVPVEFCGTRVLFNEQNGAAQALGRVAADLGDLLKRKPGLSRYVNPLGGTFTYRHIAGTERLSPHAFGIAIDLNPRHAAYWRWGKPTGPIPALRKSYPSDIVALFEKHGFIWGGKWSHYDLMHFEYRPELLMKTRLMKLLSAHSREIPRAPGNEKGNIGHLFRQLLSCDDVLQCIDVDCGDSRSMLVILHHLVSRCFQYPGNTPHQVAV